MHLLPMVADLRSIADEPDVARAEIASVADFGLPALSGNAASVERERPRAGCACLTSMRFPEPRSATQTFQSLVETFLFLESEDPGPSAGDQFDHQLGRFMGPERFSSGDRGMKCWPARTRCMFFADRWRCARSAMSSWMPESTRLTRSMKRI